MGLEHLEGWLALCQHLGKWGHPTLNVYDLSYLGVLHLPTYLPTSLLIITPSLTAARPALNVYSIWDVQSYSSNIAVWAYPISLRDLDGNSYDRQSVAGGHLCIILSSFILLAFCRVRPYDTLFFMFEIGKIENTWDMALQIEAE